MKIKLMTQLFTGLSMVLTVLVAATLGFQTFQIEILAKKEILINRIEKVVTQRRLLVDKYLRQHKSEYVIAWQVLFEASNKDLMAQDFNQVEKNSIIDDMRENNNEIKEIFSRIISLHEAELLGNETAEEPRSHEEKLLDQLWINQDSLINGANRLVEINTQARAKILKHNKIFVFASLGALIALIFGFALMLNVKIVLRLTKLIEGIDFIGKGHLAPIATNNETDEIGEVTLSFNAMVEKQIENMAEIKTQQAALITSSKMSALGEMAGGIAHEINNPLAIISLRTNQLVNLIQEELPSSAKANLWAQQIVSTTDRIAKIIQGLRSFSRESEKDPFVHINLKTVLNDSLSFCYEKFRKNGVTILIDEAAEDLFLDCQPVQISQVFLNFMNNSFDAIENLDEKWIQIQWSESKLFTPPERV